MNKEDRKIFRSAIWTLKKETGKKKLGKKELIDACNRMANAERMKENIRGLIGEIRGITEGLSQESNR
jgi:hypothetical protein